MQELQKRAARALVALLQKDPEKALEELNCFKVEMFEGEPVLLPGHLREDSPFGDAMVTEGIEWREGAAVLVQVPTFGYPCQEPARHVPPRNMGEACAGTVRAKTIGVCTSCQTQHFSAKEERRYQSVARASTLAGREVWAVGIDKGDDSYGMTNGPFPSVEAALGINGGESYCIIHFPGDGNEEVTHRWMGGHGPMAQWVAEEQVAAFEASLDGKGDD